MINQHMPTFLVLVEVTDPFQVKALKSLTWTKDPNITLDFFTYKEEVTNARLVSSYKDLFDIQITQDYIVRIKATTVPNLKNLHLPLTYAGPIVPTDQRSFLTKSFSVDAYILSNTALTHLLENLEDDDADSEEEFIALNLLLKDEEAYENRTDLSSISLLVDHNYNPPTIHAINDEQDHRRSQLLSIFPSTSTLFTIHKDLSTDPKKFLNTLKATELLLEKNKDNEIWYEVNKEDDTYLRMVRISNDTLIDENFNRQQRNLEDSIDSDKFLLLKQDLSEIPRHTGRRWVNRIGWFGMRTIDETGVLTNCDSKEEAISLRAVRAEEDALWILCEEARHLEKFVKTPKGNLIYSPGLLKLTKDEEVPLVPVNGRKVFFFWHNEGESFQSSHWLPQNVVNSLNSFQRNHYSVYLCSYQEFANVPEGIHLEDANETMEYSEWFETSTNFCKIKPIATFADIFRIRRLHKDPTFLYSDCDNFAISDKFPNTNYWFQHFPWNNEDEINFVSGSLIKFDENDPIHMMVLDDLYEMTLEDRDWNDKSIHPFINRELSRLVKSYKIFNTKEDFPAPMRACPNLHQVYLWYDIPVKHLPVLDRNLLIVIGSNGWVFESHVTWIRDNLCKSSLTQQSASRFTMCR